MKRNDHSEFAAPFDPVLGCGNDIRCQYFRPDAARVENAIEFAARWSSLHHAPVYCREFGVLRDYAPPAMRAQWLHDTRVTLEKNHLGWAMWDYQTNFGVVSKTNGITTPDVDVLNALGLHAPQ